MARLQKEIGRASEVNYHTPVLLQEILKFLDPGPGKLFIDATCGGGGHTQALLESGAKVLGIDRDPEAIEHIKKQFKILNFKFKIGRDLILVNSNFNQIRDIAIQNGFNSVDGILFDLGVSSHQLEKAERGFSFQAQGPLDMRMDPTLKVTAGDLINKFDQRRLNEIFKTFGQEKFSWAIAGAICSARQIKPIETTGQLAEIVRRVYRGPHAKRGVASIDPATKTFLALRIVVNSELLNLDEALPQTIGFLKTGGRLAIVSFHSLEDGIVKRFFRSCQRLKVLTNKPIGPSSEEILTNLRSRSAKLRVAQKR